MNKASKLSISADDAEIINRVVGEYNTRMGSTEPQVDIVHRGTNVVDYQTICELAEILDTCEETKEMAAVLEEVLAEYTAGTHSENMTYGVSL